MSRCLLGVYYNLFDEWCLGQPEQSTWQSGPLSSPAYPIFFAPGPMQPDVVSADFFVGFSCVTQIIIKHSKLKP